MEEKEKKVLKEEGRATSLVPDYKKKAVKDLEDQIKNSKTVLIASTKGLPGGQFHKIKKQLRGKAEVKVSKKSLVLRAIDNLKIGALQNLKDKVGSDVALFFSDEDAFELSGILGENQSPAKAKAGDIAPEDLVVEPGPTELMPGPAISELSGVGLKVAVENGKISIKKGATLVKEGEEISAGVSDVLGKLNINPIKVGFIPVAAYDSESDKTYFDIRIDKPGTLDALREAVGKSFGFAVNLGFVNDQTVKFLISKAGLEAQAFEKLVDTVGKNSAEPTTDKKDESVEEKKKEETTEEVKEEEKPAEDVQKNDKEVKE